MKQYLYYVFATEAKHSGNAALVVSDFRGSSGAMQTLAKKSGFPVTLFILPGKKFPIIRAFYPELEASLCVHGVLAAAKFLFAQDLEKTELYCKKANGEILEFLSRDDIIKIKLQQQNSPAIKLQASTICKLLNLSDSTLIDKNLPCRVESVGSAKALIPLTSKEVIANLHPNFELIKSWSLENGINGLYVYVPDKEKIIARNFNPKTGILEDSGTGVAAGALALALKKDLIISQGCFIGKPSEIMVNYHSGQAIYVGGKIVEQ